MFFYVVDYNYEAVRNECILFFDYCFVDMLVSYSLDSIGNKLDCWMIVWMGYFAENTF